MVAARRAFGSATNSSGSLPAPIWRPYLADVDLGPRLQASRVPARAQDGVRAVAATPLRAVGIVGMVVIGTIFVFYQKLIGIRDSNADSNASAPVGIPLESAGVLLLFIIRWLVSNYIVSNDSNAT
jgi:hypothetical protein